MIIIGDKLKTKVIEKFEHHILNPQIKEIKVLSLRVYKTLCTIIKTRQISCSLYTLHIFYYLKFKYEDVIQLF